MIERWGLKRNYNCDKVSLSEQPSKENGHVLFVRLRYTCTSHELIDKFYGYEE